MIEGFDKEIDSILRQAARGEAVTASESGAHIDADEISLFAENALPAKARARITGHLANCAKCRKVLSNVIVLNSESASENIHHAEPEKTLPSVAPIPWYRKLFAFPQLAFSMGALTVLLAGMIGYVVLQNSQSSSSSSIAQADRTTERARGAGVSSDGGTATYEAPASNMADAAPAPVANSASNPAGTSNAAQTTQAATANSTASRRKTEEAAKPEASPKKDNQEAVEEPMVMAAAPPAQMAAPPAPREDSYSAARNQRAITPDSSNVQSRAIQELPVNGRQSQSLTLQRSAPSARAAEDRASKDSAETEAKAGASQAKKQAEKSRSISGKSFDYKDGVWYDAAYKQQKTVNLRRNSDEYKKLEAGLRSAADALGGTVVIVWKGTAYRIQ